MTHKEEVEYTIAGLRAFDRLEQRATDEVCWTMLKLGCNQKKALELVVEARKQMESNDAP